MVLLNNLSKRVVKLLANILEGWHSGYCGGLENRWFRKGLASSSLAPSAILKQKLFLLPRGTNLLSLFTTRFISGDVAQLVERRTENPYVEGAHPSVPINLCYKLGRRRNPYASESEVAVGWGPTDVSRAFKDRNLL